MCLLRVQLSRHLFIPFSSRNMKITRIVLINLAVFSGLIASLEISLNIARHFKHVNKMDWEFFFHPGVGHSHQKSQFIQNANTSSLLLLCMVPMRLMTSRNTFPLKRVRIPLFPTTISTALMRISMEERFRLKVRRLLSITSVSNPRLLTSWV